MEFSLVSHKPVFELANVLLYFLELFFLHDKLIGDKGDIIPTFVVFHDGEHALELLAELLVVFRDFDFLLIIVDENTDALLY